MSTTAASRVLVGPRILEDRICRLVYVGETDEAWAEEWSECAWVRASVLTRHLLNAPLANRRALARAGAPLDLGEWDRDLACA